MPLTNCPMERMNNLEDYKPYATTGNIFLVPYCSMNDINPDYVGVE